MAGTQRGRQKKRRGILANVLLVLASCAGFLLALELTLRVLGDKPDTDARWVKHTHYNPFLIVGPKRNMTFEQREGGPAVFNDQGFREDSEVPQEKPPGEFRLIALGASTTENLPNQANLHYCGEVEKLLSLPGQELRCLNAGRSGWSSTHSLIRLQTDLLLFRPDMITVMHNINDVTINFFPHDDRNNYASKFLRPPYGPTLTARSLLWESKAIDFFRGAARSVRRRLFADRVVTPAGGHVLSNRRFVEGPVELRFAEVFRNNLVSIVAIAKAHDITPVLMTQPAIFTEEHYALAYGEKEYNGFVRYPTLEELRVAFDAYNRIIEEVALEHDAGFIDMYSLLGHDEQYFKDLNHLTSEGVRRFAEIYSEHLSELIVSPQEIAEPGSRRWRKQDGST
jgi:lysophospholipase L1-like esterase